MAKDLPPVPPLTAAGFADPVWARWLKSLRNRVTASLSNLSVATANGLGGVVTSPDGLSAVVTLRTTVAGMAKGNGAALFAATAGTDYALPSKYGHFHDTTTQTAAAATATAVTLNSTVYSNGVSLGSPTSRIVFATPGLYRIFYSLQCSNTAASDDNVTVWVRYNGADLAGSAGIAAVPAKHGSINGAALITRNDLFLLVSAGDYLELFWTTDGGTSSLTTYPAGTSPTHPGSPGVVLTAQQLT